MRCTIIPIRSSLAVIFSILLHQSLPASEISPYLPLDHWAYVYIDVLQERGVFPDLHRSIKPYKRAELLGAVDAALLKGALLTKVERSWLRLIRDELQMLMGRKEGGLSVWTEGKFSAKRLRWNDGQEEFDSDYFAGLEFSIKFPHATLLHRTVIDQNLIDDPFYRGRKDIDIAAATEDAYLMVEASKATLFIGRTRRNLGPSPQSLLVSNNASSFDQIFFELDFGKVNFSFLTARLDDMHEEDLSPASESEDMDGIPFQRYLSMHRLDVRPIPRLEIGIFEAVTYGGKGRGLDFAFTNPFSLYFVVENASNKQANSFIGFDAYYRAGDNVGFFGQLLIDDVKLSLFGKHIFWGDEVEPNEFAYLVGGEFTDPFDLKDTRVSAIYTKVTNYTYNSINAFERYTYEGKTLGPPEGNDFDRLELSWLFAPREDLLLESAYTRVRRGEGSVSAQFPGTFETSDFPFPSGVVETTDIITLRARYQSGPHWFVDGRIGYERKENYLNISGNTSDMPRFEFVLGVQWKKLI
ncbi:MAG: capsule assembly Wzi family protein [Candidatus Glassbacteria bacterium]